MGSSEEQGKLWGARARDWAELFEPMSKPIWVAMLASAKVGKGTRFLDLGCGGGGASVLAHDRGAQVAGLDASGALVDIARERVPTGDFRVGDLEKLPFDDNSFDVTFASLSIMFANKPSVALREMKRTTVSGGYATVGIWGNPEDCEYQAILKAVAGIRSSRTSGKGPFALSGIGVLERMMDSAGLGVLDSGEVDGPFRFADFDMMWRMVASVGPIRAAMEEVGVQKLKMAIASAAEPFRTNSGEISFNNRFRYVTAGA